MSRPTRRTDFSASERWSEERVASILLAIDRECCRQDAGGTFDFDGDADAETR
jgi:hypothetical protein